MQVPKDPHGTQLYWEYLVPADGISAANWLERRLRYVSVLWAALRQSLPV